MNKPRVGDQPTVIPRARRWDAAAYAPKLASMNWLIALFLVLVVLGVAVLLVAYVRSVGPGDD
jgi:hypothetical protein